MEPVKLDEILQITKGKWVLGSRELTKGEIDSLKSDAESMVNTLLWRLLTKEARYHAQRRAIVDATPENIEKIQEFHKVAVHFEKFINTIIKS